MHGEIRLYADRDDFNHEALIHTGALGISDSHFKTCKYIWHLSSKEQIIETLERILEALKEQHSRYQQSKEENLHLTPTTQ